MPVILEVTREVVALRSVILKVLDEIAGACTEQEGSNRVAGVGIGRLRIGSLGEALRKVEEARAVVAFVIVDTDKAAIKASLKDVGAALLGE